MARQTSRLRWAALIIGLATVVAYAPALNGPFLYDDGDSIPDNPSIRQLWPVSDALHPPKAATTAGRPVVNYSLALNYAVNEALGVDQRADPAGPHKTVGYHLFSLLVHLACGLLLFGILRRTISGQDYSDRWAAHAEWISLAITAIWLLHPIQTEAVDYLIQRTELIVSACYVATLYASVRAWDARSARSRLGWYAAAVAACLLGMGSKEVMISAPLTVILYDLAFRQRGSEAAEPAAAAIRTRPSRKGPETPLATRRWFYAALLVTVVPLLALLGSRNGTVGFGLGLPWYEYLYTQAWAILHYIRLFFWPVGLTLDYGQSAVRDWRGVPGLIILSSFGVATVLAWTRVRRWGWFAFLGSWFFLLLAPSSSVIPIASEIAAERRIYLALVSVIVLALVAADALWRRVLRVRIPQRGYSRLAGPILLAVCLLLVSGTFQRSRLYADKVAMWRDDLAKEPQNPRAYLNLEDALKERDSLHMAEPESLLRQVLALRPDNRLAMARLGVIFQQQGEPARAVPYLAKVVAQQPDPQYLTDLGIAYIDLGKLDSGANALHAALQLDPKSEVALNRLGATLLTLGHADVAVPYLEAAVQQQPGSGLSLALLSRAYAESGHPDDAAEAAGYAVQRAGTSPEALTAVGDAELALGKRDAAAALYERALTMKANFSPAVQGLARLRRPE